MFYEDWAPHEAPSWGILEPDGLWTHGSGPLPEEENGMTSMRCWDCKRVFTVERRVPGREADGKVPPGATVRQEAACRCGATYLVTTEKKS